MPLPFEPSDALLLVDVQVDFCPGGSLPIPQGDTVVPVLNRWLEAAATTGIAVVASRDWHPPHHVSFEPQGGPWPVHCVQHTPGAAFHPDLALPNTPSSSAKPKPKAKKPIRPSTAPVLPSVFAMPESVASG